MAKLANATEVALAERSRAYVESFEKYVVGGSEVDLHRAYELGRELLAHGYGVLDMADLQYAALAQRCAETHPAGLSKKHLERAQTFFAESLSPYEMTHRSYRDGITALRQMNETLENEIHRIAHTVHDEAGQLLVGVRLALAELGQGLALEVRDRLHRVYQILDQVEHQLRRVSHELRPTILDDLGLVPALRFLADGVSRRSVLSIQVESSLEKRCTPKVEITLYRIAQEALNNVSKHARASRVQIELAPVAEGIECRIQDDGVGFNPPSNSAPACGIGLLGMRERLAALGGTLAIDSGPGRGTRLLIKIPWTAEAAHPATAESNGKGERWQPS